MPGRVRVATWVVTERRDRVHDGATRDGNLLDERTAITVPIVSVDYRFTSKWGLQGSVAVPLIARTGVVQRPSGPQVFRDEVRGLGDSVIGAWYRGGSSSRWSWTFNAGMSMPTGSTRQPLFRAELENGSLVPLSRLQRGSGSWDPVLGLAVDHPLAGGRWTTSLVARAPFAESREGLRTGVSFELGSGYAHTVCTHKVMAYARADWLHREQDVYRGTPVLVGGGNWLYATPGLAVMVGAGVNLQADFKIPVYRKLANRQLDSPVIIQIGVSRTF